METAARLRAGRWSVHEWEPLSSAATAGQATESPKVASRSEGDLSQGDACILDELSRRSVSIIAGGFSRRSFGRGALETEQEQTALRSARDRAGPSEV